MENQQEIGGAQALLQLGSKIKDGEEDNIEGHEQDESIALENVDDKNNSMNVDANSDVELSDLKATNQQINDAVEAAVMRYVGGTLEDLGKKKRKSQTDDIMSNINEFNQWTGFLDEDITATHNEDFNHFNQQRPPKKKKKKHLSDGHNHNEIDPELTGLNSTSEHDQLVQAAIMDARELAKQLGTGSLQDHHDSTALHNSLTGLPPHQAQQVIAAATSAVQNQNNNTDSVAAINQLAQAASSLSGDLSGKTNIKRKFLKKMDDNVVYSTGNNSQQLQRKPRFNHLTNVESLIEEASTQACNWYNNLPHTTASGPRIFSPEEISAVDHFITGYCHIHKLTRTDICNRIWSNERKKDNFWESLTKVLPYRSRASVYKHVRRQYHVFEVRAKWTKEDDELLRKLASTKEGNWKEIGETMGRMPEDCRDRWRNYVKCGDNRVLNKWSEEEEKKLKEIVGEMMSQVDLGKDKSNVINWTIVSERMNGVRSRIQCRYKWNKLVKRESANRASYMSPNTRLWLIGKLRGLGFQSIESIEWDYIAHLYHEGMKDVDKKLHPMESWIASDFKVVFEKMKSEVKDHRKLPLQTILQRLIESYYNRQRLVGHTDSDQLLTQLHHTSQQEVQGQEVPESQQLPLHLHTSDQNNHFLTANNENQVGSSENVDSNDPASIANAAVAAVSSGVDGADAQQQEYSLWR